MKSLYILLLSSLSLGAAGLVNPPLSAVVTSNAIVQALGFVPASGDSGNLPLVPSTLFISTVGNDSIGTRGDSTKPFATPAAALAASSAGDTILVAQGSYVLATPLFIKVGQTWKGYQGQPEFTFVNRLSGGGSVTNMIELNDNVTIDNIRGSLISPASGAYGAFIGVNVAGGPTTVTNAICRNLVCTNADTDILYFSRNASVKFYDCNFKSKWDAVYCNAATTELNFYNCNIECIGPPVSNPTTYHSHCFIFGNGTNRIFGGKFNAGPSPQGQIVASGNNVIVSGIDYVAGASVAFAGTSLYLSGFPVDSSRVTADTLLQLGEGATPVIDSTAVPINIGSGGMFFSKTNYQFQISDGYQFHDLLSGLQYINNGTNVVQLGMGNFSTNSASIFGTLTTVDGYYVFSNLNASGAFMLTNSAHNALVYDPLGNDPNVGDFFNIFTDVTEGNLLYTAPTILGPWTAQNGPLPVPIQSYWGKFFPVAEYTTNTWKFNAAVSVSGLFSSTNGTASFNALTPAGSVVATGYTNANAYNVTVYLTATAVSFLVKNVRGTLNTTLYTSPTLTTTMPINLQPGWGISAASGLTGTVLPW